MGELTLRSSSVLLSSIVVIFQNFNLFMIIIFVKMNLIFAWWQRIVELRVQVAHDSTSCTFTRSITSNYRNSDFCWWWYSWLRLMLLHLKFKPIMVLNRTDNFCMKNIVSLELYLSWHDFNIKIFSHCRPSVEYIRFKMKWKKIYSIYDSNNDRSIIITLNTKQTSRLETVRQILRRHFTSSCLDSWQIFAWEFLLLSWKKINCRPGSLMTLHLSDWETFFHIAQLVRPLWAKSRKEKKVPPKNLSHGF